MNTKTDWQNLQTTMKGKDNWKWMFDDGLQEFVTKHEISVQGFVRAGIW